MLINDLWEKFCSTGTISDYINYSQYTRKDVEIIEPESKGPNTERDDNQGK